MRAGLLRNQVSIEEPIIAVDEAGGAAKTWNPVAVRRAAIMSVSGREYFGAGADVSEATVRITMREMPGIPFDPAWRLVDTDSGDIFDVVAVLPARTGNDLTLACRRGGSKRP